jgi:hypothetical protein
MTCPMCSKRIRLDLMRCAACGYDMLPQDIALSPQTKVAPGQSARAAAELVFKESGYRWLPGSEELAEMIRQGKRDALWLLTVFFGLAVVVMALWVLA